HAPATTAPTTATTCRTPRVWRVSAVRCPERATGSRRAVSGHCSSRRGARSRRTSSCTVGFRLRRVAFHLVCAVRDCVGDIVTRVAAATSEIVDGVDDSRARLLIVLRGPLPETHRRMGGSLTKLCGRARHEPQRQAGADERASQQAEDEAGAAAIARKLVHESGTPLSAGYAGIASGACSQRHRLRRSLSGMLYAQETRMMDTTGGRWRFADAASS